MIPEPTAGRAFRALIWFSARRHAKVRLLGLVAFSLLAVLSGIVFLITNGPLGWRLENRQRYIMNPADERQPLLMTYQQYGEERLILFLAMPGPPTDFAIRDAVATAYRFRMQDEQFLNEYAMLNYVRWVVRTLFFMFLMPLFCIAFATEAIGAERESRTLLWLMSRPLPRWAVYLGKFLGTLPWCLVVCMLGFGTMCLAGGELGRRSFLMYWDAVLIGSIAFSSLFQLMGALFRRPSVIGLVYVFFFETLVSSLPGSLKQLSLGYYVQSLFYNETTKALVTVQPQSVEVYAPTDNLNAWITLSVTSVAVTLLGMYLFGRQEPREES